MKDIRTSKEMAKTPLKLEALMGESFDFSETFKPITITPPKHLSKHAKKYYKIIAEELQKLGTSNTFDEAHLTNLAFTLGTIKECQLEIEEHGTFVDGLHGRKENPAYKVWATATQKSIELMKELNLSASTRHMLQNQSTDDDLSDL
jgi:P27 family predicted phage terminase small subunit